MLQTINHLPTAGNASGRWPERAVRVSIMRASPSTDMRLQLICQTYSSCSPSYRSPTKRAVNWFTVRRVFSRAGARVRRAAVEGACRG